MRTIGALICVLLSLPAGLAQGLSDAIDSIVAPQLRSNGPGVAVLVMDGGRPMAKRIYGLANRGTSRPITTRTRFDLASVSKPLTALVLLRLVEKGRVQLDDFVSTVLPEFQVPVVGRPVTVRDLLQHTSGLRDYTVSFPGNDREFAEINTRSHVDWLNTTRPKNAPGRRFEYNNSNYALLARICEVVGGQNFGRVARSELLRRAGANGAMVYDGTRPLPSSVAKGYIVRRGQVRPASLLTDIAGDGNFYLSINDLEKVLRDLQSGRLIAREVLQHAWANGRLDDGRLISDGRLGYGLGWEVDGSIRSHSGSWTGTAAYLEIDTASGLTVAVLSNDENFDPIAVAKAIRRWVVANPGR